MADEVQKVKETTTRLGDTVQRTTEVRTPATDDGDAKNIAERIIWFVAGTIISLLAIRFIFSLLGANRGNAIADFVYATSYPFVAPFFNLFSYDNITYGISRFEVYTLIAMLFYALIAAMLAKLTTIKRA